MLRIKTISELKERLPEVVDRINTLKIYFDTATMMLKDMQQRCVDMDDEHWLKAYAETLKNQMDYYAEMEYLQGLIKKYCK